jgi:hypothetical protein
MPKLSQITDRPFAIDLRVGLAEAAELRAPAASYSLWPEAPFGASADFAVWPGAFVPQDRANEGRIALASDEAAYWQAFQLWDDVRDVGRTPYGLHFGLVSRRAACDRAPLNVG